jgi:hypothetical protein
MMQAPTTFPARSNGVTSGYGGLHGLPLIALGVLALALRIPNYQFVPAFTDERNDILQVLRIVRGQDLPLISDPSSIGAFWSYLLAAAFWVGGESLLVPRTVVLGSGSAACWPAISWGVPGMAENVHYSGWGNGTPRDALELGLTMDRTPYRMAGLRSEDNTKRLLASSGRCCD